MSVFKCIISVAILFGLFFVWTNRGIAELGLDDDVSRDLNELSNLWLHHIVWLGPQLSVGFPASPIYYYYLFPGIVVSGGNPNSMVVSQTLLAVIVLAWFLWLNRKNSFFGSLLTVSVIGLSPWWIEAAIHPWNGHLYLFLVFAALCSLWFKQHFLLSCLLIGTAIAIHPAAILLLPLFMYELLHQKNKVLAGAFLMVGLVLPWAPIIGFEVITKGYLTRQWLAHKSTGMSLQPGFVNINDLLNLTRLPRLLPIGAWFLTVIKAEKRAKIWWVLLTFVSLASLAISQLHPYYLLGLLCAISFVTFISWSNKKIGYLGLGITLLIYVPLTLTYTYNYNQRSVTRINNVVNHTIQDFSVNQNQRLAVLSVINDQNAAPQADDYRFFLRTKGYQAVSIDDYPTADFLFIFVEAPHFNWLKYDDWHTQRFGNRQLTKHEIINGVEVLEYSRP